MILFLHKFFLQVFHFIIFGVLRLLWKYLSIGKNSKLKSVSARGVNCKHLWVNTYKSSAEQKTCFFYSSMLSEILRFQEAYSLLIFYEFSWNLEDTYRNSSTPKPCLRVFKPLDCWIRATFLRKPLNSGKTNLKHSELKSTKVVKEKLRQFFISPKITPAYF